MKKILFLTTGLNYGGAENQVVQLCKGLKSRNYEVQLVSMIKPIAYVEQLEAIGVKVHSLSMRPGVPDPRAIFRLKKIIQTYKPDVVHSHMVHANLLARMTRLFVKVPCLICTAHNINEGGKFREWLYRITDSRCDMTTNVSQEAVNRYIEVKAAPKSKITWVPNGINLSAFDFSAREETGMSIRGELGLQDEFVWLAVGRFVPEKDYSNLITAFSMLLSNHPHSVLLIAGDGAERQMVERLCESLQMEKRVRLLGIRDDISRLMQGANGYVMSSKWEGLPMVLLEASACGLPIVATDVGGNKEVVYEGINGYLVKPSNSVQLAQQMRRIMEHSGHERQEMGSRGHDYVKEFYNIDHIIGRWERLYEQMAN